MSGKEHVVYVLVVISVVATHCLLLLDISIYNMSSQWLINVECNCMCMLFTLYAVILFMPHVAI